MSRLCRVRRLDSDLSAYPALIVVEATVESFSLSASDRACREGFGEPVGLP